MRSMILNIFLLLTQIGIIAAFIFGLRKPIVMAAYAVMCIPLQNPSVLPVLHINQLAIVAWLVLFFVLCLSNRFTLLTSVTRIYWIVVLVLGIQSIFALIIIRNLETIREYLRLVVAVALPTSIYAAFKGKFKKSFRTLAIAWVTAGCTIVIVSLANLLNQGITLADYGRNFFAGTSTFYQYKFLSSPFFADPNNYGGYLNLSLALTGYLFYKTKHKRYVLAGLVLLIGLFTSFSRGAYIAILLALIFILIGKTKTRPLGVLLLLITSVVGFSVFAPKVFSDTSALSRLDLWKISFKMFAVSPVFGVGLENYTYLFPQFASSGILIYNPYTHNLYLKILTETGFIGFYAIIFTYMRFIKSGNKGFMKEQNESLFFLFGILCFLIQGMSVEYFSSNYFWCFAILGQCYLETQRSRGTNFEFQFAKTNDSKIYRKKPLNLFR